MPYMTSVPYEKADGAIKDAYDEIIRNRGRIANVFAVNALRPHIMTSLESHSRTVMQTESGLNPAERQMIATVVSALNKCVY